MSQSRIFRWRSLLTIGIVFLLVLILTIFTTLSFIRPPRTNKNLLLFPGVLYERIPFYQPRSIMIHVVTIYLNTSGMKVLVTPRISTSPDMKITARTTSEFVNEFDLQLGINANFFYPFYENTPWDFYPRSGDLVNVVGRAISHGNDYSVGDVMDRNWPTLCFNVNNYAEISDSSICPTSTTQAISGNLILVANGQPVKLPRNSYIDIKPYPRTAVGINQKGDKLWLVLVDGKQPFYSDGMTVAELQEFMINLGVDKALNLDGGGSTTLVVRPDSKGRLLNSPVHTWIPMRERSIANHLGFSIVNN
ncbi:phosphodiester glycosidase family protein [Okeania sp.]|uniref:phosphodiester glycosidase family protein n=1 Tax=Okeania sp. TaxID=3100323 RepID=UPI002B4AC925|nr:phosphodiester glycosidase family protein [Okeania sp.]MEB3343336.1 phosphodiester glycosidase family protein [Okeania sp.]